MIPSGGPFQTANGNDNHNDADDDILPLIRCAASMDMSLDGMRLVIASPRWQLSHLETDSTSDDVDDDDSNNANFGYVQIFHYSNTSNTWIEVARLIRPDLPAFGRSVTMAGNGQRVVIGAGAVDSTGANRFPGQVLTYEYDNTDSNADNNTASWCQHEEAIREWAPHDGTGTQVALNHNGTILAIGVPRAKGKFLDTGAVRVHEYNKNSSDFSETSSSWRLYAEVRGQMSVF